MDDLAGLDWSSTTKPNNQGPPANTNQQGSFYPSLRPTPSPQISGRNTPLSSQTSGFNASKPATSKPAVDSFSNLVNFGGAKNNANLSLRERQEQLEAEKRRKEEERRKQMQSQYGGGQYWDTLGQGSNSASRTASPSVPQVSNGTGAQNGTQQGDDEDLFAAFKRDTKVDNSSYYPPPIQPQSGKNTPPNAAKVDLTNPNAWNQPSMTSGGGFGDDDDPFGLNQLKSAPTQQQTTAALDDDDDFLGDLGKPVEEVRRKAEASHPEPEPGKPIEDAESDSEPEAPPRPRSDDPFDKAVAELVDMGFTAENARRGLTESGAGLNVQAVVGWLLDDAHRTAREKQKASRGPSAEHARDRETAGRSRDRAGPAWMREDRADVPPRGDNTSPASGGDLAEMAAAMGSSFLKTANSLWKTGQKQVQKAVAEFNHEGGDPSQPKWMRSVQEDRIHTHEKTSKRATNEAMMLESGSRPDHHPSRSARQSPARPSWSERPRDSSPALRTRPSEGSSAVPKWQQSAQSSSDPRARLRKQAGEEESAQHYVSKNRRKNITPQPQTPAEPEPDLLFNSTAQVPSKAKTQQSARASPAITAETKKPASRTATPRPTKPARQIPAVSPSVIQASNKHRLEGTAHFKRGDFDAAHISYSNSLRGVPQAHPLCIVLLTNRSLTALKTGNPKQAVTDADAAISIIGPSCGEGEKIEIGDGEQRDMKDLYGKALSRKAEALEQMEKWADAGEVWQISVEAGVGGATAIAGRQRCQRALAPKPKPAPKPAQAARPRPKPSGLSDLGPQKSSEAVQRLREANRAAEQADDEKFALSEKVDARISAWRDGKRDNLRALLGSLDQVLWEGSGWKKVGLHELVVANRVKIHYMKAIAKTHPDKLPQDANTEVKLIAGLVFATLNEAWDKFKAENGL